MPRVAPRDADDALGQTLEEAILAQRRDHVAAATGLEAADRAEGTEQGAECDLVEPDGQDQQADREAGGPEPEGRGLHGAACAGRSPIRRATACASRGRAWRASAKVSPGPRGTTTRSI